MVRDLHWSQAIYGLSKGDTYREILIKEMEQRYAQLQASCVCQQTACFWEETKNTCGKQEWTWGACHFFLSKKLGSCTQYFSKSIGKPILAARQARKINPSWVTPHLHIALEEVGVGLGLHSLGDRWRGSMVPL